jgi:outer membrane protein OmpA-like peptidoglycan-associated protein
VLHVERFARRLAWAAVVVTASGTVADARGERLDPSQAGRPPASTAALRGTSAVVNTLQVEFGFNRSSLDDSAKSMLMVVVREVRDTPGLTLDLEGYADPKGSRQYNIRLSQRRVEAVRAYLIEQGVQAHRIKVSARGPTNDAAVSDRLRRRVKWVY